MSLTNATSLRLSDKKQRFYEAEAAARNLPLRTYLRQRLESEDNTLAEIATLRRNVEAMAAHLDSANSERDQAVHLEILLLLRQLAPPNKVQLAQAELKRLGFNIWQG